MQGVVHDLRRSVTSIRRTPRTPPTFPDETRGLVRCDSSSSPEPSVVLGARRSKTIATSRPRSKYP